MRMIIKSIAYTNIRRISDLTIDFTSEGSLIGKTFVMMGNGTGKTTTIELLKGLLSGEAASWNQKKVKEFAYEGASNGKFELSAEFDGNPYTYILEMDYMSGDAKISTSCMPHGLDEGTKYPDAISGLFTKEFVERFIFDGEQPAKALDDSTDEAENMIKYLYRLDEIDEIKTLNRLALEKVQQGSSRGSEQAVKGWKTKMDESAKNLTNLRTKRDNLQAEVDALNIGINALQKENEDLFEKYKELSEEKEANNESIHTVKSNIKEHNASILEGLKQPSHISKSLCKNMKELGDSMQTLKLPSNTSKDFFIELAGQPKCVCGREITINEKNAILRNASRYLGDEQQSVMNEVKSALRSSKYDDSFKELFGLLDELVIEERNLQNEKTRIENKLISKVGAEAEERKKEYEDKKQEVIRLEQQIETLNETDNADSTFTIYNNIPKAQEDFLEKEKKYSEVTNTHDAYKKRLAIDAILDSIKKTASDELKKEIIEKTNEKLKKVIKDDVVEIEGIEGHIRLKKKAGASAGQELGIAYCFLGTLFEDSELEFPFVIDSPAGSLDFVRRTAIAKMIPDLFKQMIAFVTSSEVEKFANCFYDDKDSKFVTIEAEEGEVRIHEGVDYFDTYQKEHRED